MIIWPDPVLPSLSRLGGFPLIPSGWGFPPQRFGYRSQHSPMVPT
uniref:Beta lactamase n=1 Tax=Escherichia coli TaxID=562 RepID=I7H1P3_ECOLX|nr:beta lactamase [Escherichia coli]